ncbi:MAG: porin family protein [Flavobacterium sp.]|nr:MAG: porin family protein [Flavobacterium sp.]
MKKALFIVLLVSAAANAQVTFTPGLRAGSNFSKITKLNADFKPGFYGGVFGGIKFTQYYTLQPEINVETMGARNVNLVYYDSFGDVDGIRRGTVSLTYISVAIINKITFNDRFNFQAGTSFDTQAGRSRFTNSDIDFSLCAGFEYGITKNLFVQARIKKGMFDVFDSDYSTDYESRENTNMSLQAGIAYTFDLK